MPLYGQNVCRSAAVSASATTSSRGTYQRGREARLVEHQRAGRCRRRRGRRRGPRGGATCGGCRCGGRGRRRGRGCGRPPRRRRPSPASERDLASRIAACSGSATCCQAPRAALRVAADDLEPGGLAEVGVLGAVVGRPQRAVGEVGDAGSTPPGSGPARRAGPRRRSGDPVRPPSSARIRRRSGSAYSTRSGMPGTRNRPLGLRPSGPCCHERPIVHRSDRRWVRS